MGAVPSSCLPHLLKILALCSTTTLPFTTTLTPSTKGLLELWSGSSERLSTCPSVVYLLFHNFVTLPPLPTHLDWQIGRDSTQALKYLALESGSPMSYRDLTSKNITSLWANECSANTVRQPPSCMHTSDPANETRLLNTIILTCILAFNCHPSIY